LASTHEDPVRYISDTAALEEACERLAEGAFLALDTEFHRETTYWPQLCLIQAANEDFDVLIDPLADLDLAPLLRLVSNPEKTKVFHAARQDLEIFTRLLGSPPSNVFDTQIAAMACGLGDSISYEALVSKLLREQVDKSLQFTDWTQRPLTERQLAYARGDVTFLRRAYVKLRGQLERENRFEWIEDEHRQLCSPELYACDPAQAWKRLKLRKHKADYLAVLANVAAWRETVAQEVNRPRGRILKDDAIQEIALQKPRTAEALDRLRAVPSGFARSRHGIGLIAAINAAVENPSSFAPHVERQEQSPQPPGALIELLRVLLKQVSDEAGVAPRLIANAADLETIARMSNPDVPALSGWRRELFGEKALALKAGRLALSAAPGGVRILVLEPDGALKA